EGRQREAGDPERAPAVSRRPSPVVRPRPLQGAGCVKSASLRLGETETFSNLMTVGFPVIGFSIASPRPPTVFQSFHCTVVGGSSAPFRMYCHWTMWWPSRETHIQYTSLGVMPTFSPKESFSTSHVPPAGQ